MRIIKRVMVAIGAPMCLLYVESSSTSPTRAHTQTHTRTRAILFDIYTCVARTGRRDSSGAQLEIRGPLFAVLVFRISPSGTEDAVSGDRIYGLAASTWKEYREIYWSLV